MAKRVKALEKSYASFTFLGALARQEGHAIDYVECTLLRDPQAQVAWRDGWRGADEELKLRKPERKRA